MVAQLVVLRKGANKKANAEQHTYSTTFAHSEQFSRLGGGGGLLNTTLIRLCLFIATPPTS